jgi:hypothetical protein
MRERAVALQALEKVKASTDHNFGTALANFVTRRSSLLAN